MSEPWSAERLERLRALCSTHSVKELAQTFGVSEHRVRYQLSEHGLSVKKRREFIPTSYSEADLQALRARCLRIAARRGRPELSEDFASWLTIDALSHGRRIGRSLSNDWLDYFRVTYGKVNTPKREETLLRDDINMMSISDGRYRGIPNAVRVADEHKFGTRWRTVFILIRHFGFTFRDLGLTLGITAEEAEREFAGICLHLKEEGLTLAEV